MVIIEFASLTAAQQFYQSQEYAAVKALRQGRAPRYQLWSWTVCLGE